MAFNGSGTYVLPAGNPVYSGTPITSSWANTTLDDIATALTDCVTRDGQSPATANLPMGGFKITGIGAAVAAGDAVRYEQIPFLGGTALPVASGGTGAATLAANNVLLGNGTSALQAVAPSTAGNILTSNGTTWGSSPPASQIPSQTGQSGNLLSTNGTTVAWIAPEIPSQTGQSGNRLSTNGTTVAWVAPEIPSQSGQSGKYLSTNGTTVAWSPVLSPSISVFNLINFGGF